jgi:hypothetical protein
VTQGTVTAVTGGCARVDVDDLGGGLRWSGAVRHFGPLGDRGSGTMIAMLRMLSTAMGRLHDTTTIIKPWLTPGCAGFILIFHE